MVINVGIIGATGHTGEELIEVLLRHPNAKITGLYNTGQEPQNIAEAFPKFKNRIGLACKTLDRKEIADKCDIVFLALPHTVSMGIAPQILKLGKRVIDLSADYRLANKAVYEKFYCAKHTDGLNLKQAVYGLPEIYRANIKNARLIANPGCYSTCAVLALAPAAAFNLASPDALIIDAKSGVSGAGKKVVKDLLFLEVNEDFKAYKVNAHQHMPEINQVLSALSGNKVGVTFVPHLLPLNRGILETIYLKKTAGVKHKAGNLIKLYRNFYKDEQFIRIKDEGQFPRLKDVIGTNFCDIGIKEETDNIIIIAVLDNLLKGASGQAVQNMNIMCGIPEQLGLL